MTPRAAVRLYLLAHATVGPLVGATQTGGVWSGRIYPKRAPQSPTLPALVIHRVSVTNRLLQKVRGPIKQRLQVNAMAATEAACEALAEAVTDALHGTSWWTTDQDEVLLVTHDGGGDLDTDEAGVSPSVPLCGQRDDYIVTYRKAA